MRIPLGGWILIGADLRPSSDEVRGHHAVTARLYSKHHHRLRNLVFQHGTDSIRAGDDDSRVPSVGHLIYRELLLN